MQEDKVVNFNALKLMQAIELNKKNINTLNDGEIEHIARKLVYDEVVADCSKLYEQSRIDMDAEVNEFLSYYCRNSRQVMNRAIGLTKLLSTTPCYGWGRAEVDNWYRFLVNNFSHSSAKSYSSAVRMFCGWVGERHKLGTPPVFPPLRKRFITKKQEEPIYARERKVFRMPSMEDVETVIKSTKSPMIKFWVAIMYWNGLRTDGVRKISIKGIEFTTSSKGCNMIGKMHINVLPYLCFQGKPFIHLSERAISKSILSLTKRLHKKGLIEAEYSAHKFRHACAVRIWLDTMDMSKVARTLGHRNLTTTDKYLKSITGALERDGCRVLDTY